MKYTYFLMGLLSLCASPLLSQSIEKMTFNQGSTSAMLPGGEYISFSIGEGMVGSYEFIDGFMMIGARKANQTSVPVIGTPLSGVVYPNPAKHKLWLKYEGISGLESISIRLIDPFGKEVWEVNKNGNELQTDLNIPIQNLPTGIYWLQLKSESEIIRFKIMKI